AVPAQAGAPRSGGLFLTVSGSENTWIRGLLLRCPPNPTPHPKAAEACAALDAVRGNFDKLPVAPGACTLELDPVTVSASGTHRGRPLAWHKTFPNACAMAAATGPVFAF
ncbi:SSI family serine proteinase inhibitor, partial [Streptomyces sp. T-3]|nr:SSI family serine proteinase inhibitor [Streptomyces sp. T-3]